eukprot:6391331-Alexandrium_andersonii.AAC.1
MEGDFHELFRRRGIAAQPDGSPRVAGEPVRACLTVLPMGWSWAFWLVQKMHEEVCRQAGIGQSRIL